MSHRYLSNIPNTDNCVHCLSTEGSQHANTTAVLASLCAEWSANAVVLMTPRLLIIFSLVTPHRWDLGNPNTCMNLQSDLKGLDK